MINSLQRHLSQYSLTKRNPHRSVVIILNQRNNNKLKGYAQIEMKRNLYKFNVQNMVRTSWTLK